MMAFVDYRVTVETATFVLAVIDVTAVIVTFATITTMVRRQHRDLASSRTLGKAILQLSLQLEAEERKTRHAVKDLIAALQIICTYLDLQKAPDFTSISRSLEEPPDFLAPRGGMEPRELIEGLIEAVERETEEEAAAASS